jgi:hypothetical protein
MDIAAETYPLSQEEQGRMLARIYAFILSDKFTGTHKEQDLKRTTPSIRTCQPQLNGIIQVVDAQELVLQEVGE